MIWLTYYRLESKSRKLPERVIRIVLTDREVNKVSGYAVKVNVHEVVKELQPILVDVTLHCLLGERLCPLEVLDRDLRGLFEDNQPVNIPGVETQPAATIVHKLGQEFEDHENHVIILDHGRESLSDDGEEFWVEPVEEEREVLLGIQPMHYASQYVKQLH